MLPPTPQLLVSMATGLAAQEYHRRTRRAEDAFARADTTRGDSSLRFVHFAGFWSHFIQRSGCSSWPLPPATPIQQLAAFAEQHGAVAPRPVAGDVFLLASVRGKAHVFAGIVSAVEAARTMLNGSLAFVCDTIEGELRPPRSVRGRPRIANVLLVRRLLSPAFGDCFIHWWDLPVEASDAIGRAPVAYGMPKNLLTLARERRRAA